MYRKNVASQFICFQLNNVSTGAGVTGATVAVRRCIDGTFAAGGGTVTEDTGGGSVAGYYKYAMSQADTNGNDISFNFSATNAITVEKTCLMTAADPSDAVRLGLTALPNAAAEASGGLYTRGTGAGQINQDANGRIDANVKTWISGAIPAVNVTGVPLVDAKYLLGTIFATPNTAGIMDVNAKQWNGLTTVALPLVPTVAGRTLDVSAGGEAGLDWANIGSPTTTVGLTNTTVGIVTLVNTVTTLTNLPAITAAWLTATGIAADAITAAKIADGAIDTATFAAGTTIPRCTLVDTLTTYTGNTPQTGDSYALANGANGFVAIKGDTAAIKIQTDKMVFTVTGCLDVNAYRWNALTTVALPLVPTVAGRTLDVSAGGEAGVDWANVGTPGSTVNLSATTVNLVNTTTTVTNQLTAAAIATGVWTDTTAGDFTVAASIGKSVMNGVALGTGLTINAYTGNTPQTGDSFARIGVAGVGLTNVVLPSGGLANVVAWTVAITGNLSGSVGSVTGTIGGMTAAGWAGAFTTDTTKVYADAVAGSVVKETASHATITGNVTVGGYAAGQDPATLVFAGTVEVGVSFLQATRAIASAAAGVLAGAGTTSITIAAIGNPATPRIVATVDTVGDRSALTLTL